MAFLIVAPIAQPHKQWMPNLNSKFAECLVSPECCSRTSINPHDVGNTIAMLCVMAVMLPSVYLQHHILADANCPGTNANRIDLYYRMTHLALLVLPFSSCSDSRSFNVLKTGADSSTGLIGTRVSQAVSREILRPRRTSETANQRPPSPDPWNASLVPLDRWLCRS